MIFLFDMRPGRPEAAQKAFRDCLIYRDHAWRDRNNLPVNDPNSDQAWFLVHDNNWELFVAVKRGMGEAFHSPPIIQFTGGNASGKPMSQYWVRYRAVSGDHPFTHDELAAMDQWVKGGCRAEDTPWLCAEPNQLYLIPALTILCQGYLAAHSLTPERPVGAAKKALDHMGWTKFVESERGKPLVDILSHNFAQTETLDGGGMCSAQGRTIFWKD